MVDIAYHQKTPRLRIAFVSRVLGPYIGQKRAQNNCRKKEACISDERPIVISFRERIYPAKISSQCVAIYVRGLRVWAVSGVNMHRIKSNKREVVQIQTRAYSCDLKSLVKLPECQTGGIQKRYSAKQTRSQTKAFRNHRGASYCFLRCSSGAGPRQPFPPPLLRIWLLFSSPFDTLSQSIFANFLGDSIDSTFRLLYLFYIIFRTTRFPVQSTGLRSLIVRVNLEKP